MLILILLVFSLQSSNGHDEVMKCSSTDKCPDVDTPLCAKLEHNEKVYIPKYKKVRNVCELEKLRCHKGVTVTVAPMKICVSDLRKRNRLFGRSALRRQHTRDSGLFSGTVDMQVIEISLKSRHPDLDKLGAWNTIPVSFGFIVDVAILSKALLPKIRNIIKSMTQLVANDASRHFKDLLLTVYAWPTYNGTFVTRTSNEEEFSQAVDDIKVVNGGTPTCAEQVYQSTISALQKALPNSHMYVFVAGMPSEEDVMYKSEVVRLAREKGIAVNFVGTGLCGNWTGYDAVVHTFYDIAAETMGQVLKIGQEFIEAELPQYVKATVLEFQRRVLISEVVEKEDFLETRVAFRVNEENEFVTVSASGEYISSIIFNNKNNSIEDYTPIINMDHIKVDQYRALDVGEYYVRLYSNSSLCGLLTVATSNIEFYYNFGFSAKDDKRSLAAAVEDPGRPNPKAGNLEYVVIEVTSPDDPIDVKDVEFYDLEHNMLAQYALTPEVVGEGLRVYRTQQIDINAKRFKVAVTGIHRTTEKLVRSVAPRVVRPYKKWPNEKTSGEEEQEENAGKGSQENTVVKTSDYEHVSSISNETADKHSDSHAKGDDEEGKDTSFDYYEDVPKNDPDYYFSERRPRIIKNDNYICNKFMDKWAVQWTCKVSGAKSFSMKWLLRLHPKFKRLDKDIYTGSTTQLDVLVNERQFRGRLTCVAKNKAGEDQYTIQIRCPKRIKPKSSKLGAGHKLHGAFPGLSLPLEKDQADNSDTPSVMKLKYQKNTLHWGATAPVLLHGTPSVGSGGNVKLKIDKTIDYSCHKMGQKWVIHKECRVRGTNRFDMLWSLDSIENRKHVIQKIKDSDEVDLIVNQKRFKGTLTCTARSHNGKDKHSIHVRCPRDIKHWKNKLGGSMSNPEMLLQFENTSPTKATTVKPISAALSLICPSNTTLLDDEKLLKHKLKLDFKPTKGRDDPECPIANA